MATAGGTDKSISMVSNLRLTASGKNLIIFSLRRL